MSLTDEDVEKLRAVVNDEVRFLLCCSALYGETNGNQHVDLDAEGAIVSAVLCGHVKLEELELTSDAFYADINRRLYRSAELGEYDPNTLTELAEKGGYRGDVHGYIRSLMDGMPFVRVKDLRTYARRLVGLKRRRDMLEYLAAQVAEVSAGRDADAGLGACLDAWLARRSKP